MSCFLKKRARESEEIPTVPPPPSNSITGKKQDIREYYFKRKETEEVDGVLSDAVVVVVGNTEREGGGRRDCRRGGRTGGMKWWSKMIFPVRRVWIAVSTRLTSRKTGAGILKLHDDVQTCEYQDVQVMWEMLSRAESELITANPKRKQRPFWKILVWSNRGSKAGATSLSEDHV